MNHSIDYCWMPSPLGDMLLVGSVEALKGVYFADQKYRPAIGPTWTENDANTLLRTTRRQLDEYFGGTRNRFDLPIDPQGTPFQREIWKAIAGVRWGATATYTYLAVQAGRANCARAAGAATGRNPLSIVVPCHRIDHPAREPRHQEVADILKHEEEGDDGGRLPERPEKPQNPTDDGNNRAHLPAKVRRPPKDNEPSVGRNWLTSGEPRLYARASGVWTGSRRGAAEKLRAVRSESAAP